MAEPITKIKRLEVSKEALEQQDLQEINHAVIENKEAILQGIDLLASLHEKGFWSWEVRWYVIKRMHLPMC
ncbi:hypothetical protein P5G51_012240 [Virgibacillus sp. 179-BFC.A HS]|uniref:Uncharacterized protein n=1 Tax=Tigheibacillus jepli TaxID=3035914 RepID=A0ABU5CI79_9BACI|nr:hypothetical protein [Virgibacillus sp. 179-BFC.A HS]MDY0406057.1 hypothetical protein [Virgibacillus sp. 179-BFC.A HS]